MKITVAGCGRWGSFIAWYLDKIGHSVTLWGRRGSDNLAAFIKNRSNGLLTLPETIRLSSEYSCFSDCEVIVVSIPSQSLGSFLSELSAAKVSGKTLVLCMKGIDISSGKRLSELAEDALVDTCGVAVWLGPGHVQEFLAGIPNCMVIDSKSEDVKKRLVDEFSSELIRFYYGRDLIGNEIGAAAKNVIGIAAGMLDALGLTTLKGALMSRGTREIARLIKAAGGNELSAYGLCHLGDYEATVFSKYSHNRSFGEAFVRGESYGALAEGFYTVKALVDMSDRLDSELPICRAVYDILYFGADPKTALNALLSRSIKHEF